MSGTRGIRFLFVLTFLVIYAPGAQGAASSCRSCHNGIEPISDILSMKELPCEFCHRGHPEAGSQEEAHRGMWANPSDFRVADQTCGQCHETILENSKKSLHATSAGIISATLYTWGAQRKKGAVYANYQVKDKHGTIKKGALHELKALPKYDPFRPPGPENHPAYDYLRNECLRCHLYSYGMERYGDFRPSGCAACHVIYSDSGLYAGKDRAIALKNPDKKKTPARPLHHRLSRKIPPEQCIHCHNRGGRTGVSFIGTMESDGYGSPWSEKPGKKGARKVHGKYYNHLVPDVHYEKGLYCVDCHTAQDCHGDGNIYSKKENAVEIECVDCHGTPIKTSLLKTSWGNPLKKVKKEAGNVILLSVSGKRYVIPQVKDIVERGNHGAKKAMGNPKHMERMECYACHSRWAPQCYGCHAQQDCTTFSHDWLSHDMPGDISQGGKAAFRDKTCCKWHETRSYLRWESPALGINAEGKISPFIPGCQVFYTQISKDGSCSIHNKVFTTFDGISGIASNPIQPHTISRRARTCPDCHANPKASGLGHGIFQPIRNGLDIPFGLEQIVDQEGRQLQATSHDGARPFNRNELERIKNAGKPY